MWTWLPTMQLTIPACGFSVFNVWECPYEWWLAYVEFTKRIIDARKG